MGKLKPDDWQGRGLGSALLRRLARHAARRGLQRLFGEVLLTGLLVTVTGILIITLPAGLAAGIGALADDTRSSGPQLVPSRPCSTSTCSTWKRSWVTDSGKARVWRTGFGSVPHSAIATKRSLVVARSNSASSSL